MPEEKKILICDASGINWLLNDSESETLTPKLKERYRVRITQTNLVELSATKDAATRARLLDLCQELLQAGDTIVPYHSIIERMAECHARYKERFSWTDVDVRDHATAAEIVERQFVMCDVIAAETRCDNEERNQEFLQIFRDAQQKFEARLAGQLDDLPETVNELIAILKDNGTFWKHAAGMYEKANFISISDRDIRGFIRRCPPFHAAGLVSAVAQFQYAFPPRRRPSLYKAGRLDLFVAPYLAYADVFVTNDGGQASALRAIGKEVGLPVRVLDYSDFKKKLLADG
jgi:hypothetical protein